MSALAPTRMPFCSFADLCRVTDARSKCARSLSLAALGKRVSTLLNADIPATAVQGAACKFMQVLSCYVPGKTFGRARGPDGNRIWSLSKYGRKLLKLKRSFDEKPQANTTHCETYCNGITGTACEEMWSSYDMRVNPSPLI